MLISVVDRKGGHLEFKYNNKRDSFYCIKGFPNFLPCDVIIMDHMSF